jgi:hypothetical protein
MVGSSQFENHWFGFKEGEGMDRLLRVTVGTAALVLGLGHSGFADDRPKSGPAKITITAKNTPFKKKAQFKEGDCWIVVLPNGKEVALWAEKDRFPVGEQRTKCGLQCMWGEKPFRLEPLEKKSYIEQGPVITVEGETSEHQLFVAEWKLSYINDLTSSPHLNTTITVTKRERPKKEGESSEPRR